YFEQIPELIQKGLMSENDNDRDISAKMIQYAPESEQETLKKRLASVLKMGLKNQDESVRRNCA
ncbi:TPA: hypothetical protein DEP26_01070, partial [Candidatus Uhrbacteria bacterium]|nr:hypothetical protein [Candidatus Uhrbacteria bacterium]